MLLNNLSVVQVVMSIRHRVENEISLGSLCFVVPILVLESLLLQVSMLLKASLFQRLQLLNLASNSLLFFSFSAVALEGPVDCFNIIILKRLRLALLAFAGCESIATSFFLHFLDVNLLFL